MSSDDIHLFWAPGNLRSEAFRLGELMAAQYGPGEADGLQFAKYFEGKDITLVAVVGDDWRDFMIRRPDWREWTDSPTPWEA